MNRIILIEEQARQLNPLKLVEFCNPKGDVVAKIPATITAAELAEIRRAKDITGPRFSGEQVRESLAFLEEAWQCEGPFDETRMQELLGTWRARQT